MTKYSPAKTGEYPRILPNFQNCARYEKDLKDNKDKSRHLGRKYARIFVLGHCLFLVAHSFHRALLSENCSLLGTDNVRGQISIYIFVPNGDYCLFISGHWRCNRQLWPLNGLTARPLSSREGGEFWGHTPPETFDACFIISQSLTAFQI